MSYLPPPLGPISITSVNKVTVTPPASSATVTIADGATLIVNSSSTVSGTNTGDQTNISGNSATVTTNANLTGIVTSVGNGTAIADGAIALAKLASGTAGNMVGYNSSGTISAISTGNAGQVLTSNGTGNAATMQTFVGITNVSLTAFATGGQGSATVISVGASFAQFSTCANAGDSGLLPIPITGQVLTVLNDGVAAMDLFPSSTNTIENAGASVAYRLSPGCSVTLRAKSVTAWNIQAKKLNTVTTAGSYTALWSDNIIGVTSFTASRTMTLPAVATMRAGDELTFTDEAGTCTGTTSLILDGNASETINGATTYTATAAYSSITIVMRNAQWWVI